MSLEMVHNSSSGDEYLTINQVSEHLKTHKYIVAGCFLRDIATDNDDSEPVAKILYKGDNETAAKKAWLHDMMFDSNSLFCKYGRYYSDFRVDLNVSDVRYANFAGCEPINSISYPIGFFDGLDEKLSEPVTTKQLKESAEDMWYVVRVFDIDLAAHSFIGQVVYKSQSKQEAVDVWMKSAKECGDGVLPKHYYIFNPSIDKVTN